MWSRSTKQRKAARRRKHSVALAEVATGKRRAYHWEGKLYCKAAQWQGRFTLN